MGWFVFRKSKLYYNIQQEKEVNGSNWNGDELILVFPGSQR